MRLFEEYIVRLDHQLIQVLFLKLRLNYETPKNFSCTKSSELLRIILVPVAKKQGFVQLQLSCVTFEMK
jgi:hypothetical protein